MVESKTKQKDISEKCWYVYNKNTLDILDINTKCSIRDQEGHFTVKKKSIHQEDLQIKKIQNTWSKNWIKGEIQIYSVI